MPEPGKIKKKKPHRFYDYSLLFTIIFLTVFGLIMIYSASSYKAQLDYGNPGYFMLRQAGIAGVSFVAMYIVSKIDYHWFARFAMLGYIVSYVTLLLTRFTPLGVASADRDCQDFPDSASGGSDCQSGRADQPAAGSRIYRGAVGAAGTFSYGEQLKFWYHHLRHRVCDAVCGVQDQVALLSLRGSWHRPDCRVALHRKGPGGSQAVKALSAGPYHRVGGSDGYGHRISDAPGSVRHRLRRLFRKMTGTEPSEAWLCAGSAE